MPVEFRRCKTQWEDPTKDTERHMDPSWKRLCEASGLSLFAGGERSE
jgi:hypothetical protein